VLPSEAVPSPPMWRWSLAVAAALLSKHPRASPPPPQSAEASLEGSLRLEGPTGLKVDRSCWTDVFTVELCCLPSYRATTEIGCWEHADQWEFCCRAFVLWRPPSHPVGLIGSVSDLDVHPGNKVGQLQLAHKTALDIVLEQNLHEGMIFGRLAAELGYERCVEVGVFGGTWSEFFLVFGTSVDGRLASEHPQVRELTLVDLWRIPNEESLGDDSFGTNLRSSRIMQSAVKKVERFWPRVTFVQKPSVLASRLFDEAALDFVFIDAGHDYCSVWEDLQAWWPKVRSGGLMAGDDYLDVEAVQEVYGAHQDWSRCANGTVHPGAVMGAVDDFAAEQGVQLSIFRMVGASLSPQWLIFKP